MKVFDRVYSFLCWIWGPYNYPRWQRRTYILLWPVLMPLRYVPLAALILIAMLGWGIFKFICWGIGGFVATITDFCRYIQKQRN